jgi:hypothetical protein
MKKSLASLIVALAFVSSAQGAVTVNAFERGGDVFFSGGGSLNTLAWEQDGPSADFAAVEPDQGNVWVGETPAVSSFRFINPDNFSGPSSFGTGGKTFADKGTGGNADGSVANDIFGLLFNKEKPIPILVVPGGYQQGSKLSGLSIYNSITLAGLGLDTGTYRWEWGFDKKDADSFTLNVGADLNPVPVPAAIWLFGTALVGFIGVSRRRKVA